MTEIWVDVIASWYKIPIGISDAEVLALYRYAVADQICYVVETARDGEILLTGDGDSLYALAKSLADYGAGQIEQMRYVALAGRIYDTIEDMDEERAISSQWN